MAALIQVGCLTMTQEQFDRALREEMTISQAQEMIRREKETEESEEKEDVTS